MPFHSPGLYTYTVSHLCVFSCGRLVLMGQKNVFCICRNDIMASPQRVFGCVQLDHSSARRLVHNLCNDMAFHRCALSLCLFRSDGYEQLLLHSGQTSLALADFAGSLVDSCCPSKLLCGSGSLRSC